MGLGIKRHRNLPIGLDLGSSELKMAQLRIRDGGVELLAAEHAGVPAECRSDGGRRMDFVADRAYRMLRSGGFRGRDVVLSLPAPLVFLEPVRIPMLPPDQVDSAVAWELRDRLPFPTEDAVIRHFRAGTIHTDTEARQERIVVAVHHAVLERHLGMARQARLNVVGVNAEACAVAECFARLFRRKADASRVTLFLDIGYVSTRVALCYGAELMFARNLPTGGRDLDAEVARALKVPLQQAQAVRRKLLIDPRHTVAAEELLRLLDVRVRRLARELTDCLRYYESSLSSQPIERVVFLGGQAHDKRLCKCIAEHLNLPAQVGDPMAGVRRADGAQRLAPFAPGRPRPAWAVAFGLSLGAAA